jgi:hypothetical protein
MNQQLRRQRRNVAPHMGPAARGVMAVLLPIAAIVGALLFVGWILAMMSLVTQNSIFGGTFRMASRCGWDCSRCSRST